MISLYVARKYFYSRHVKAMVHIISTISVVALMVATTAMVIVISTFNGLDGEVERRLSLFESDLRIFPVSGKYIPYNTQLLESISKAKGVIAASPVLQDNAIINYQDRQHVVTYKAMLSSYTLESGFDTLLVGDNPNSSATISKGAIIGLGVANQILTPPFDNQRGVQIRSIKPDVTPSPLLSPEQALNSIDLPLTGVYSLQQSFDSRYIILPYNSGRVLSGIKDSLCSYYEVRIDPALAGNITAIRDQLRTQLGANFRVLDRVEQQPLFYKLMQAEKLGIYTILGFIVLLASFNLVGALLMYATEKKADFAILSAVGVTTRQLQRVIFFDGIMLSGVGGLLGIALGILICWLQMQFGFVSVGGEDSTFVIKAFPVILDPRDLLAIFSIVLSCGLVASSIPPLFISNRIDISLLRQRM